MTDLQHLIEVLGGLGRGLWWLWLILGTLLAMALLCSGGVVLFVLVDQASERWHTRRGYVRVVDHRTGRERWVRPDESFARTAAEIRHLPEVSRG